MPCKYARGKYNYTPNDFDLEFDYTAIPANIRMEDASNLSKRLQQVMPLTKIIHLNLHTDNRSERHYVNLHTSLHLTQNNRLIEVNLE